MKVECWKCHGSGYLPQYAHIKDGQCYPCNGTGYLTEEEEKENSKELLGELVAGKFKINKLLGINPKNIKGTINKGFLVDFYNRALKDIGEEAEVNISYSSMEEAREKLMNHYNPKPVKEEEEVEEVSEDDIFAMYSDEDDLESLDDFIEDFDFDEDDFEEVDVEEYTTENVAQEEGYIFNTNNPEKASEIYAHLHSFIKASKDSSPNRFNKYTTQFLKNQGIQIAIAFGKNPNSYTTEYGFQAQDLGTDILEELLEEDESEGITEIRKNGRAQSTNGLEEFMQKYGKRYEGDYFTFNNIPRDAIHGSNFNVIMPDDSVFNYTIETNDAGTETHTSITNPVKKVPVTKKGEVAKRLKEVSSKLGDLHVDMIQNVEQYLDDLDALYENTGEDNKTPGGFRSMMNNYTDFNDNLLNTDISEKNLQGFYDKAQLLIRNFSPEEIQFFTRLGNVDYGKNMHEPNTNTYKQAHSFLTFWYSQGGDNYATSAVIDVLEKSGIIKGSNDYILPTYLKDGIEDNWAYDDYKKFFDNPESISPSFKSAVLKMYLLTQHTYKREGKKEMELYRGIRRVDASDYKPRSLESWSSNKKIAQNFGEDGSVLTRNSNVENVLFDFRVFNTSAFDNEAEYVLMSDVDDTNFTWEKG